MVTEKEFQDLAEELGVEVAALKAVVEVECSSAGGFLRDGRPRILFEGHIFWRRLALRGIDPEPLSTEHPDIIHPRWDRSHYLGGAGEWGRFNRASAICHSAAIESASWGLFQIMGFHWRTCGCSSAEDFAERMSRSESEQMRLAMRFLQKTGIAEYLKTKDWATFALRYNGSGYKANRYDTRLQAAYEKLKKLRVSEGREHLCTMPSESN